MMDASYHRMDDTKARALHLLTCSLCTKQYDDPRVLPCQHTFCCRCLQTHVDASAHTVTSSKRPGAFQCPLCSADVGLPAAGVTAFPVDRRISNIRDLVVEEMAKDLASRLKGRLPSGGADSDGTTLNARAAGRRLGNITEGPDDDDDGDVDARTWPSERSTQQRQQDDGSGFYRAGSLYASPTASASEPRFSRRTAAYSSLRESRTARSTVGSSSDHFDSPSSQHHSAGLFHDTPTSASTESPFSRQRPGYSSLREPRTRRTRPTTAEPTTSADSTSSWFERRAAGLKSSSSVSNGRATLHAPEQNGPQRSLLVEDQPKASPFDNLNREEPADLYTPIIGRNRSVYSSLRERRRRPMFDPDVLFDGESDRSHKCTSYEVDSPAERYPRSSQSYADVKPLTRDTPELNSSARFSRTFSCDQNWTPKPSYDNTALDNDRQQSSSRNSATSSVRRQRPVSLDQANVTISQRPVNDLERVSDRIPESSHKIVNGHSKADEICTSGDSSHDISPLSPSASQSPEPYESLHTVEQISTTADEDRLSPGGNTSSESCFSRVTKFRKASRNIKHQSSSTTANEGADESSKLGDDSGPTVSSKPRVRKRPPVFIGTPLTFSAGSFDEAPSSVSLSPERSDADTGHLQTHEVEEIALQSNTELPSMPESSDQVDMEHQIQTSTTGAPSETESDAETVCQVDAAETGRCEELQHTENSTETSGSVALDEGRFTVTVRPEETDNDQHTPPTDSVDEVLHALDAATSGFDDDPSESTEVINCRLDADDEVPVNHLVTTPTELQREVGDVDDSESQQPPTDYTSDNGISRTVDSLEPGFSANEVQQQEPEDMIAVESESETERVLRRSSYDQGSARADVQTADVVNEDDTEMQNNRTRTDDQQNYDNEQYPVPGKRHHVIDATADAGVTSDDAGGGYVMATGVTALADGSLVVADYGAGCVCLCDADGQVEHRVTGVKPFSVAAGAQDDGVIFVGDRRRKTLFAVDRDGSDVAQWPDNQFDWVCGIVRLPDGLLAVLDRSRSYQLGVYSAVGGGGDDGRPLAELGGHGSSLGNLCMAEFVAADSRGRLLVADSGNHCVKAFDRRAPSPSVVATFGSTRGSGDAQLQWPKGVTVDADDNVLVADSRNSRVVAFSVDGRPLGAVVSPVRGPFAVCSVPTVMSEHRRLAVTTSSLTGVSDFHLYHYDADELLQTAE